MKKVFSSLVLIVLALTVASCTREKIVVETVEKEVIVEVPVYVDKDNDDVDNNIVISYDKLFTPGVHFKSGETNKEGVTSFVVVVVDDYGLVSGVHFDNTNVRNSYLYDEETNEVYIYVHGVTDVIPNSYRVFDVNSGILPTVSDALTTEDLIVGYPAHDAIIKSLKVIKTNETTQIADTLSDDPSETWSHDMNLVAAKIVSDQTTLGINTYKSGNEEKISNISGVNVTVTDELELVQDLLNEIVATEDEAKTFKEIKDPEYGFYKKGQNFYSTSTNPVVTSEGIDFQYTFVAVDNFGRISGVFVDETTNDGNNSSTKYLSDDKEYIEDADKLGTSVVLNQTLEAFDFVDDKNKKATFEEAKDVLIRKGEYVNPVTISNSSFDLVANPYMYVIDKALEDQKYSLEGGSYFINDEDGNIMTLTVDQNEDGENVIAALTLDKIEQFEQAYATIDGEVFKLYTYKKYVELISLEVEEYDLVIYKDGESYYHVSDNDELDIEAGDRVKFEDEIHDEEETIVPLPGYSTAASVYEYEVDYEVEVNCPTDDEDEKEDSTDSDKTTSTTGDIDLENGDLSFYEQSQLYTRSFLGLDVPYGLNMLPNGTTDSVEGLTMKISDYNKLLSQLLFIATDSNNASDNIVKLDGSIKNDLFKDDFYGDNGSEYLLADGSYYAVSNTITPNGGFYYLTLTVKDNQLYTMMLDETIYTDGSLVTRAMLGDDVKVEYKDGAFVDLKEDDIDKNSLNFVEAVHDEIIKNINLSDFVEITGNDNLLDGYDYEVDTTLERDADFVDSGSEALYNYNDAFEKALLQALRDRVQETINDTEKVITDYLSNEDNFVVAAEDQEAGSLELELFVNASQNGALKDFNILYIGGEEYIDLSYDTDDRELEVDDNDDESLRDYENGTTIQFTAEADELINSRISNVEFTLGYDVHEDSFEDSVVIYSNGAFKQLILDIYEEANDGTITYINDEFKINNVSGFYEGMTNGSYIELKLALEQKLEDLKENDIQDYAKYLNVDPSRLGDEEEVNDELYFKIEVLDEVQAFATKVLLSDDSDELTISLNKPTTGKAIQYNGDQLSTYEILVDGDAGTYVFGDIEITLSQDVNDLVIKMDPNKDTDEQYQANSDSSHIAEISKIKVTLGKKDYDEKENVAYVVSKVLTVEKGDVFPAIIGEKNATSSKNEYTNIIVLSEQEEKGQIIFRAFYDAYDQEDLDEGKGSYQKGEAYRDFSFFVYGDEELHDYAKREAEIGTVLETVTSTKHPLDLTDTLDAKIAGMGLNWSGSLNASGDIFHEREVELLSGVTAAVEITGVNDDNPVLVYAVEASYKADDYVFVHEGKLYSASEKITPYDIVDKVVINLGSATEIEPNSNGLLEKEITGTTSAGNNFTLEEDDSDYTHQQAVNYFSFIIVTDSEGNKTLKIEQFEDVSVNVELNAKISNDALDKTLVGPNGIISNKYVEDQNPAYDFDDIDLEFRVAEKTDYQLIEDIELSIEQLVANSGLDYFEDKSDLSKNTTSANDIASDVEHNSKVDNGSVEVMWYIDGRQVNPETEIGKALLNYGAQNIKPGESERFNIKFVVKYEFTEDGEEYSHTINKVVTVYSN